MSTHDINLNCLIQELEKRWRIESNRRAIRLMYFDLAARNNDADLLRRLVESEATAAPSCFVPKKRKSFWESFVEYALSVWVVAWLLGIVVWVVYSLLN